MDSNEWSLERDAVEVILPTADDFLKVAETLTRMGVAGVPKESGKRDLYQSCHILHKRGRYFIMHFKELFLLDGRQSNFDDEDRKRRNLIVQLLEDWGLIEVSNRELIKDKIALNKVRIVKYKQKSVWNLIPKYSIGNGARS